MPAGFNVNLGMLPPQAIELEQAVLGACISEKDAYFTIAGFVRSEDFYKESHQLVWMAMERLAAKSEPIDLLTVTFELRTTSHLERAGGSMYVAELMGKVSSAANIETHARIITEASFKRGMINFGQDIIKKCYDESSDALSLYDDASNRLIQLENGKLSGAEMSLIRQVDSTVDSMMTDDGTVEGVCSAYDDINRRIYAYENKSLTVVAARPSVGKSLWMINEAVAMAAMGYNVLLYSLEMSYRQQVNRILSLMSGVAFWKIRSKKMSPKEKEAVREAARLLKTYKLTICDDPVVTPALIKSRLQRSKLRDTHPHQVVFIDYLQLMSAGISTKDGNRNNEVGKICRDLKITAMTMNVPIVLFSQLSRAVGNDIPQLFHLRDSGEIEQHVDLCMFLYRPEMAGKLKDSEGNSTAGLLLVCIRKNRFGALDDIEMNISGEMSRISERKIIPGLPAQRKIETNPGEEEPPY